MNDFIEEIREENALLGKMEAKIRRHKVRFIRRITIALIAVILIIVGCYVFVTYRTYTDVRILDVMESETDSGERYERFGKGILKYSRDGVSYINESGKEQWNASYQIRNPIINVNGDSAAIANKSGNDISVFQNKGLKGEIHTNLPIEKIAVSKQGIVSAILKDGNASKIVCYDAAGNILVEHKTSAVNTGYPIALDISDDGYMLMVSYLKVENGIVTSKVAYYDFGGAGKSQNNYLIAEDIYEGVVIPTVFFLDDNTSAAVADNAIMLYGGKEVPEKTKVIDLDKEIKSVFHDDKYVGVVLRNDNDSNHTVKLYRKNGKEILSEQVKGGYKNVKIEDGQIILHEGKRCHVITKSGIHKFDGEFETDIAEIFPVFGVNKYLLINANGLEEIRFAK